MPDTPPGEWLKIDRLGFGYHRTRIFSDLSLSLTEAAPVLTVVGPSGVGKSTLIGLLAGHLGATAGTITVCGERVHGPSATRPVVFQDHNLFPWKSVLSNVVFGLKALGVPREDRDRRGRELLASMRLAGSEASYPRMLSGGMRQRVGLARALAVKPACVLMDEPFNALDPEIKEAVQADFQRFIALHGTHAVIVTHDLGEAVALGSHVLVLRGPGDAASLDLSGMALPRPADFPASTEFGQLVRTVRHLLSVSGDR